ncbi:MAG: 30S ribosomal protein S18 [Bacteroidota bacterium]
MEEGKKQEEVNPIRDGKKYCRFRKFGIKYIDYNETNFLLRFLNPQGKILPRRLTGTSAKYQRLVNAAIKKARILAMLPFLTDNLK